ncbi:MAG TPA: amino acid-binding protein, partial [Caulobacteraceae bacterium]|nr:amino acid-binding protein [Caulobacteraceae bacterium]
RQVTAILTGLNVNIETFETQLRAEPHAGGSLFQLESRLRLPPALRAADVQAALEALSAEIMVDISLSPSA